MQVGGRVRGVERAVVRTAETCHFVAYSDCRQGGESGKLYVLRRKGKAYLRRDGSDVFLTFQPLCQVVESV